MSRFEVSLIYHDLPTGISARQFLNHVMDHCQLASEFSLTLWKEELFHLPEISEQAVLAACDAELVILSLRGDLGLGVTTQKWLTQWVERRGNDEGALAVLIDCDMQRLDSVGQTLFRLQDITRSSQVRLFVGFVPSLPAKAVSPANSAMENGDTWFLELDPVPEMLQAPAEGGINE